MHVLSFKSLCCAWCVRQRYAERSITRITGNLNHYYTHRVPGLVNIWGGCWFFLSLDRCENPSYDSLGHSSINNFWDSDALRSSCLIPALMLCYCGPSQWIFLDDELSQTADVSEFFFRQIRSLLQLTMQPHKSSCWHNHGEKASWHAAGSTARMEGKGL